MGMLLVKSGESRSGLSGHRCDDSASHKSAPKAIARQVLPRAEGVMIEPFGPSRRSSKNRLRQFSGDHERGRRRAQARPAQPLETEYSKGVRREYHGHWYWPIRTHACCGNAPMRISRNRGPRALAILAGDVLSVP